VDLVERLLSRGLDSELEVQWNCKSCLDLVCINNDMDMVRLLIDKYKAEICVNSVKNDYNYRPLN